MSVRNYKYRIYPNKAQSEALSEMLVDFCDLYNACLQQRMEAYRRRRITISYFTQYSEIRALREGDSNLARWSFTTLAQVMRRVDHAYKGFLSRRGGFPRFRASSRYHVATFRVGDGLALRKNRQISIFGIPGTVKVKWHRTLPVDSKLATATLTLRSGKWFIAFSVEKEFGGVCGSGSVGIDLGLNALIATSDGETVEAPRFSRKAQAAQRRRQRALARCKRNSKRRLKAKARLAAGHARIARQRAGFAHKLSHSLVSRYQGIAFENLNMAGLKRGFLARSVHDAAWNQLIQFTTYKAESAGGSVVLVDPRRTSQTCPSCGTVKAKTLGTRTHRCDCGAVLDRDVAAAMIVHRRAFGPERGLQTLTGRDTA